MDLNWKKTYSEIVDNTAEVTGFSKEEIENVMDSFFDGMKYYVTLPTMPRFILKEYFTFGPNLKRMKNKIYKSLKARNEHNEDRIRKLISNTWRIIKRIEAEKKKGYTHWFWLKIEKRIPKVKGLWDLEAIFRGVIKKTLNTSKKSSTKPTGNQSSTNQSQ